MGERRYSDELLDRTIETYQPYHAHPLTRDDAQEILSKMVSFFRQLQQMDLEATREERLLVMRAAPRPPRGRVPP